MLLIPKKDEPDVLWCPHCGSPYLEIDTVLEENFNAEHGPKTKTKIKTAKKKKKFYDKQGNEITDPTLIHDLLQGKTIIKYHEEKSGEKTSDPPSERIQSLLIEYDNNVKELFGIKSTSDAQPPEPDAQPPEPDKAGK